jgi:hypothetical protein
MRRLHRFVLTWLASTLMLAGGIAAAQGVDPGPQGYFTCKDPQGRALTSDRMIPECANREQREYSSNGTLKRIIEAPLSPEQRRQREIEDKQKADADLAANERRRLDRVLLSSYSNVPGIEAARERALAEPRSGISKSQARIADLKKERVSMQEETEFYKNKPLPPDLDRRIKDNDSARLYEQDLIDRRNAEIVRINDRYNADRARFLELTSGDGSTKR